MSKKMKYIISIAIMLSVFFCQSVFAWNVSSLFKKPQKEYYHIPDMKMYTKCEEIENNQGAKTWSTKDTPEDIAKLFDGDEKTVFIAKEPTTITFDLGRAYMLAGIRFLPSSAGGKASVNRCLGTEFFASADSRNFHRLGRIEPKDNKDGCYEDWQEIYSTGTYEYRYIQVKIPVGAGFAELKCLEYCDWVYTKSNQGKYNMCMKLQVFDVKKDIDGTILTAVYNKDGILKSAHLEDKSFKKDVTEEIEINIPATDKTIGDSYRIQVWEDNGDLSLASPLNYTYDYASEGFSVSNIFSDDMMFQAEKPLVIWGNAPMGTEVEVVLENVNGGKLSQKAVANSNSQWQVELGSFSYGGQYELTIRSKSEKKKFENITFGDIWLCVGQSNMDYYMMAGQDTIDYLESKEGKEEVNNSNIRVLNLWDKGVLGAGAEVSDIPINYGEQSWREMGRDTANYCSAVGYYFAQGIQREFGVPVGIINSAVGDTEINRWIEWGKTYGQFSSTDGGLYFNRVAPFQKLQICGILMYQGEADQYRTNLSATQYRDALSGLINDYRSIWGEDLPFYWAQLTRHKKDESLIREGQRLALEQVKNKKNIGIVPLIDLYGEYEVGVGNCREDIHPHQKDIVADRFMLYAKRDVYGVPETVVSGPRYIGMRIDGKNIELTFECSGELKIMPPERYADEQTDEMIKKNKINVKKLQEFEIAGEDGVFVKAEATIKGNKVIVHSNEVLKPVAVRYAWGAYPEMPNLTDTGGLPALSFSTATE